MSPHPNLSTALGRVVVDQLAASGVRVVVVCPGSRSSALAIAAAEDPEISTRVFIDERSAGFYAVGVARASGRPVALISTSGTAVANFYPAVIEAEMSCVPLVVVSADRPPELRGVGANQTIDQFEMFGTHVRRFNAIEAPGDVEDHNRAWREVVAATVDSAIGPRPGPVHLNVSFREPTVPVTDDGRSRGEEYPFATPRLDLSTPPDPEVLASYELNGGRGLVIAGDGPYDRSALLEVAATLRWPVLATALSGLRGAAVVDAYHEILRHGLAEELVPDVVVAVGSIGPDPRLESLIARASHRVRIDGWGRTIDPGRNATAVLAGDAVSLLATVDTPAPDPWSELWTSANNSGWHEVDRRLGSFEQPTGAGVAAALNKVDWGALVVASSLPIREVDAHLRVSGEVFANRGASGIDGFVSMALGVASVKERCVAVVGDLSFLHDGNGFLNDQDHDLTLVLVDNHGGGLFDTLPQARHAPHFEQLFVTPPRRDLAALARFHGASVSEASSMSEVGPLIGSGLDSGGLHVLLVPVDRHYDAAVRV